MIDTNIGISGIQNEIHDYMVTGHGGERCSALIGYIH